MRQVVVDTETTGLEVSQGHRIIEIGCVEIIDRRITGRHYHQYVNPQRSIDQGALEVHGINEEFLSGKPFFNQIATEFIDFVTGAELVIHNAPFDLGFIDNELDNWRSGHPKLSQICTIIDTLLLARGKHPGQRNNLDALCQRYSVDNSGRALHGALLDAEILADVYLLMTGGQTSLGLSATESVNGYQSSKTIRRAAAGRHHFKVIKPSKAELTAHEEHLDFLDTSAESGALWRGK